MYRHGMSRIRHLLTDEPHWLVRTLAMTVGNGTRLPPHAHDWHQLVLVQSGALSVTTDAGTWVVPPRWAVVARAGTAHSLHFHGRCRFAALYLRPCRGERQPSRVVAVTELLAALVLRAVAVGMLDRRDRAHRALVTLLRSELPTAGQMGLSLRLPRSPAAQRVAAAVVAAPGGRDTVASLAAGAGVSVRTLERCFRAETGLSLGAFRQQARCQFALRLLASGRTVDRVARAAGYRSASAFIAAFRCLFGTSPGRFCGPSAVQRAMGGDVSRSQQESGH